MSNFATRFKEEIDKKGLRPSDVAIMTGINKATISQYLSGKYLPKQDKLLKIAAVLKVKPSELDDWDESEAPHRPPSQNLLELIFKNDPEFLAKISRIELNGKINEPGVVAHLTQRQQERIRDIIILTYNEAIQNGGTATVKTVPAG